MIQSGLSVDPLGTLADPRAGALHLDAGHRHQFRHRGRGRSPGTGGCAWRHRPLRPIIRCEGSVDRLRRRDWAHGHTRGRCNVSFLLAAATRSDRGRVRLGKIDARPRTYSAICAAEVAFSAVQLVDRRRRGRLGSLRDDPRAAWTSGRDGATESAVVADLPLCRWDDRSRRCCARAAGFCVSRPSSEPSRFSPKMGLPDPEASADAIRISSPAASASAS
jgi:hypothetical protein